MSLGIVWNRVAWLVAFVLLDVADCELIISVTNWKLIGITLADGSIVLDPFWIHQVQHGDAGYECVLLCVKLVDELSVER